MNIFTRIKDWAKRTWAAAQEARIIETIADAYGNPKQWEAVVNLIQQAEEQIPGKGTGAQKDAFVRQGLNMAFDAIQPYLVNILVGLGVAFLKRLGKI